MLSHKIHNRVSISFRKLCSRSLITILLGFHLKVKSIRGLTTSFSVCLKKDAVWVVAVDAVQWRERTGFHDDAVEGISAFAKATADKEAFGRGGIVDGMDSVDRMDRGAGTTFL